MCPNYLKKKYMDPHAIHRSIAFKWEPMLISVALSYIVMIMGTGIFPYVNMLIGIALHGGLYTTCIWFMSAYHSRSTPKYYLHSFL